MFQKAIFYQLILLVLASPYVCLWEPAEGAAPERMHCSCCHHEQQPETPQPSKTTDFEPTCFCQGAIVQQKVESPDSLEIERTIDRIVVHSTMSPSLDLSDFSPLETGYHQSFPPGSTGRDICMLVSSFLL